MNATDDRCDDCRADAGEPCRPDCLGYAAMLDALATDSRADYALTLSAAQETGADYTWERFESGGHGLDVWPADGSAVLRFRFNREGARL